MTLEQALRLLLDHMDYTKGACEPTEMVAACVPKEVLMECREALTKAA